MIEGICKRKSLESWDFKLNFLRGAYFETYKYVSRLISTASAIIFINSSKFPSSALKLYVSSRLNILQILYSVLFNGRFALNNPF